MRDHSSNALLIFQVQCNGIVNHNHLTRSAVKSDSVLLRESHLEYEGISRRTRTFSASCPGTKNELSLSQLSPTGSDITHHLRSRKQMWLPTSLLGTTAEDALSNSRLRMNRDYPITEALKSPKSALKSPVMPVFNEKSKTCKEEEENVSSKSNHEFNHLDGKEHDSGDEEDVEFGERRSSKTSETSKSKEKSDSQTSSLKKKAKKKIPRELANLSYEDNRRKVQKKRLSVEEKLIEDNKTYYKVEVLNSKLRSTGYYISQSQRELEMSKANGTEGCVSQNSSEPTKPDVKSEGKEPVVVRFKKVRKTELSVLSDEAESFMFGEPSRRESSVSTESSEEDDEVSLKMESEDHDRIGTRIKKEVMDENSMGSSSITSSSTCSRRKKKSADESVLHDNIDYYKFEPINSRLRFPNNFIPPENKDIKMESPYELRSENKNSLKVKLDESDFEPETFLEEEKPLKEKSKYSYESLEFSFERVPTHEQWYQTFKRQDDCNEFYYPSYSNYPQILLPYEYPNSVMKRLKVSAINAKKVKRKKGTKVEIVKQLIQDDKPRKSPRCHASTLAIMSSLKRRRLRDSPDKKSDLPSELSISSAAEILVHDEESRCSTILDPPSVAPSDTPLSVLNNSIQIPEIKLDSKAEALAEAKKHDDEIKETELNIDTLFTEVCNEDKDDLLAHLVLAIKKEVDSCPAKELPKKGKCKTKSTPNKETVKNDLKFDEVTTCLPIDPSIFDEYLADGNYIPGPSVDVMNLIEGYRSCSSMERADYEHMNPHAVDALRVLIADSCNSSDCGGSSACDYSFLEDGSRVSKKRKKKKRNMTGWPAKKRFSKKIEELSTVVLRRNCRASDKLSVSQNSTKETQDELASDKQEDSEVSVKLKDESSALLSERLKESEETVDSVVSDTKAASTISRTNSIDSSSTKSFDQVQACYIKVKKMPDDCIDSVGRCLRTRVSESSTPSRRGNSRHAKVVGRESLRRCR